jgi:hypothetical protein
MQRHSSSFHKLPLSVVDEVGGTVLCLAFIVDTSVFVSMGMTLQLHVLGWAPEVQL